MSTTAPLVSPSLDTFTKSLRHSDPQSGLELLTSLLKRRQIRGARPCAIATAKLMRLVIERCRDKHVEALLERVRSVGRVLTQAQPREIAVGNVVRRILGMIREEAEEDRSGEDGSVSELASDSGQHTPWDHPASPLRSGELSTALGMDHSIGSGGGGISSLAYSRLDAALGARPSLFTSQTSHQPSMTGSMASMFDLLSVSAATTPGTQSPVHRASPKPGGMAAGGPTAAALDARRDIKDEVMTGVNEIIDELDDVDAQIAAYAPEHIHSAETVLVHGVSHTVQRFLLRAAAKRKFTVIHAEAYPNNHLDAYAAVTGKRPPKLGGGAAGGGEDEDSDGDEDVMEASRFAKPLVAAGVTVILIPDAAIFALMSRVNKVILGTHGVLANGGLVAQAGARVVAQAARAHRTPVVVVTGVYKLSPLYPFDFDALIEYGDSSNVLGYEEGDLVDMVDVENPLFDYVPPELVDLFVTNLGGHAPSYLYRIVSDHYRKEDTSL